MSLPSDPNEWFVDDLAAIDQRIARSSAAERTSVEWLDAGEKRYRHLVENSLGLICTHALDGTVLSVNPAAADSLGYETGDGIGRNLREFLSPSTRHLFADYLHRMREHSYDSGLMRVVRKDGIERLWLYRNVLYAEPGIPPYILGHALDVTERVAAELTLRKRTQTLEATARLAGRVAHTFNNLLTVILGSTESLLEDARGNPSWQSHLQMIVRATGRAAAVTRQFQALGGEAAIDNPVRDLNAVVAGLEPLFRQLAGGQVDVVLDPRLATITGDAARIEEMLLHLAADARAANPKGGTITIETSSVPSEVGRVRNHPEARGWHVCLTVRGDAMNPERGFEPSFAAKSTSLDAEFGLSTVSTMVDQLGGWMSVEREPGRGTSITIALPAFSTTRAVVTAPAPAMDGHTPSLATILLVDEEVDVRALIRVVLQQKGYTVLEAPNGTHAIGILEQYAGRLDMLVTDAWLSSGISGRQLYEQLKGRHPGLKVLYLSSDAGDAFARQREGSTFLPKPFLLDTLVQEVRKILERD